MVKSRWKICRSPARSQPADGRYLTSAPARHEPEAKGYHWFIGDGMVHGIALQQGALVPQSLDRSKLVAAETGMQAAPGPRHPRSTQSAPTCSASGRTWALVEAGSYPVELSDTLDEQTTIRSTTRCSAASPRIRIRSQTGETTRSLRGDSADIVRHVVIDPDGKVVRELPIRSNMALDPRLRDHRSLRLILDLPVTFSMKALIGGHGFPYRWNPDHQARVGLLPRNGGEDEIIWVDCPQTYIFHVANAYDTADGKVVLDACVYDTMFAETTGGPAGMSLGLERWTIDPVAKTIDRHTIDASQQEFPRPDERFFGQPYRYAYTMALPPENEFATGATRL